MKPGGVLMLLAVDTNILARALTDDGTEQSQIASACFRDNEVFIAETVILETEWLLRSRLKVPRDQIQRLLLALLSWPKVGFADRARIADAVIAHAQGVDFADALHALAAKDCELMLTFDDDFVVRATNIPNGIRVNYPKGYRKKTNS